jgi:hypothetical protein
MILPRHVVATYRFVLQWHIPLDSPIDDRCVNLHSVLIFEASQYELRFVLASSYVIGQGQSSNSGDKFSQQNTSVVAPL